jgi:uncharacterized protein DUF2760
MIMFFMVILIVLLKMVSYHGIDLVDQKVSALIKSEAALPQAKLLAGQISMLLYDIRFYVIPVTTLAFCLTGLLLWLFLRLSLASLMRAPQQPDPKRKEAEGDKEGIGKSERKHQERRMYLYLLSLLQREGRLLDFFSEDLNVYEDAQIGAAVRSVQENCRKVIDKNLVPKPVIDGNEGEEVTIDRVDTHAVMLTGEVVGEPPFQGILRHRGWQARKLELPTLSGSGDSNIIMPAEVEILESK